MLKQLMDDAKQVSSDVEAPADPVEVTQSERSSSKKEERLHAWESELKMEKRMLDEFRVNLDIKQRELHEAEGLLDARAKLVELRYNKMPPPQPTQVNGQERQALEALQKSLEEREHSLEEAQKMLNERDAYVEECENTLVERTMELSELEAALEQREEDFFHKASRAQEAESEDDSGLRVSGD